MKMLMTDHFHQNRQGTNLPSGSNNQDKIRVAGQVKREGFLIFAEPSLEV